MTAKLIDLWLFDNYVAQQGGSTRDDAISELLTVLGSVQPVNPIKNIFLDIFDQGIYDEFIELITGMSRKFFDNKQLLDNLIRQINDGVTITNKKQLTEYFLNIGEDKYEESQWDWSQRKYLEVTMIKKRDEKFNLCVGEMKKYLQSTTNQILRMHLYIKSPGHAMGVFLSKIDSTKYAFYFINTGDSCGYQDINVDCKKNGGIMCFIVNIEELSRFLTFIYIFDGLIPTDNFYNILLLDLIGKYNNTQPIDNTKFLNQYSSKYLFQIETPIQIIGNCSFKALIFLLEILFIEKNYSINYLQKTYKLSGKTTTFTGIIKFDLSPAYILFYNLSKLYLIEDKENQVNLILKSSNKIDNEYSILIQKLNDQLLFLKNEDNKKELFFDQIKLYSDFFTQKSDFKDKYNKIIQEKFVQLDVLNEQILEIVYEIIGNSKDSLSNDNSIDIKVRNNTDFSLDFYNSREELDKNIRENKEIINNLDVIYDIIKSITIDKLDDFINIITFIDEYCKKLIDYRNLTDNILGVRYYISKLPIIFFDKILKGVYKNKIKTNSQQLVIIMSNIYKSIYILNSDSYCLYDSKKCGGGLINTDFMDIIMIKDYTQIIFLSIIVILNLLDSIKKLVINNHLKFFQMYIGSFIIRNKNELELIKEFREYLIRNNLYQYILVPVYKNELEEDELQKFELQHIDIFDNYELIKLNDRQRFITYSDNSKYLSTGTEIRINKTSHERGLGVIGRAIFGSSQRDGTDEISGTLNLKKTNNTNLISIYYSLRDMLYVDKEDNNRLNGQKLFDWVIPVNKLDTTLELRKLYNDKSIKEVEESINRLDNVKTLLLYANIKLYASILLYESKCDENKKNNRFVNNKLLNLSVDNSNYSYIDLSYNYFNWSYGSISKIIYNIADFVKGNAKSYKFLYVLYGTNLEIIPSQRPSQVDDQITSFSSNLKEPRSEYDRKNITFDKIQLILTMLTTLFETNTVNKGSYLEYEKIMFNLLMIIEMYILDNNLVLNLYIKMIYDINTLLKNEVLDYIIYIIYSKNNELIDINIFNRFIPEYINKCKLILNNILKLTRVININTYICNNFAFKYKFSEEFDDKLIVNNLLKIFDILMMYQLIAELVIDKDCINKDNLDYNIIFDEHYATQRPQFSELNKILDYDGIEKFVNKLMEMYNVKFLIQTTDSIHENTIEDLIIKKNYSCGTSVRNRVYTYLYNNNTIMFEYYRNEYRRSFISICDKYDYSYLYYIKINNNDAFLIKNKETFTKDDGLLQLYFRSDYSYINLKSYEIEQSVITQTQTETEKRLFGSLFEVFKNKDSENKIIIYLYQLNYLITFNDKYLLKMSEVLGNEYLAKCYFKILLCINSHWDSRPASVSDKNIVYNTDVYNELLVLKINKNEYEFYCPQLKAKWIYLMDKSKIYYDDWEIELNTSYPYYISRYIYKTNIMVGKNLSGKYIYIGSYIKNFDHNSYTGLYELEVPYNDIFLEKDILILGYFLKENLKSHNINEANNILAMIIKNTNLLLCQDINDSECSIENKQLFRKYIFNINELSSSETIYLRYFSAILIKIFILTHLDVEIVSIDFDNSSIEEINFYLKINKLYFPNNPNNSVGYDNLSLNYKDFEKTEYSGFVDYNEVKFIKDINAYNAIIFIIKFNQVPNSNLKYYKNSYFAIGNDNQVSNLVKYLPVIDRNNIDYNAKINFTSDRVWEKLQDLEDLFSKVSQLSNLDNIVAPGIENESFNDDYNTFISIQNSSTNYILKESDLDILKSLILENIEKIQSWYNKVFIQINSALNNCFNTNFWIINNIQSQIGKNFLNNYINLKKLFLLKEQVDSLLNVSMEGYDCTEIYNLIQIQPLYSTSEQTINLAYFEYLSGYVVRPRQFDFTLELFAELKMKAGHRQKIHQMLMGEGKSSTIAPLITLLLLEENHNKSEDKTIIHVMPSSLVPQSYSKVFNNIFFFLNMTLLQKVQSIKKSDGSINMPKPSDLFKKPITIISDYFIKASKISNAISLAGMTISSTYNENISNSYLIFDEVDEIADPLKSQLNMIDSTIEYEKIDYENITYDFIFKFIFILYFDNTAEPFRKTLSTYSFRILPHLFLDSNKIDPEASELLQKYYNFIIRKIFKEKFVTAYKTLLSKDLSKLSTRINIGHLNLIYNFGKIYNGILRQLHRRHFGLKFNSRSDISVLYNNGQLKDDENLKEYFVAVPFTADEKPSDKSEFTDHLFIIALTIICYYDNPEERLRKIDIQMYLEKIKELWYLEQDLKDDQNDGIIRYQQLVAGISDPPILTKKLTVSSFKNEDFPILVRNFDIKYYLLEIIFKKFIRVIKYVNNLSFIDIMSSNYCERRVGFTGTPFISIPKEVDSSKELEKVEKQTGADGAVVASIIGLTVPNQIVVINTIKEIIAYVLTNNYHAVIDCGSTFINNNSFNVAKGMVDFINKFNKSNASEHYIKCVVFLNENDIPVALDLNYKLISYDSLSIDLSNRFYYYDQGHITGIDLKIYLLAKGLITVSSFNRFRDIAQGIFRLRKINRGQTVDFVINDNLSKLLPGLVPVNLVNYLVNNEITYNRNQKALFNKQNVQAIYRNYFEKENKLKLDIKPTDNNGKYFTYLNINIYRQPIYLNFNEAKFLSYDLLKFSKDEFEYLIEYTISNEPTKELIRKIIAETDFNDSQESSAQVENEEQQQSTQEEEEQEEEQEQQEIYRDPYPHLLITYLCKILKINLQDYFHKSIEINNTPDIFILNKSNKNLPNIFYFNQNVIILDSSIIDKDGVKIVDKKKILSDVFYKNADNFKTIGTDVYYYLENYTFNSIKEDNEIAAKANHYFNSKVIVYKAYLFRVIAPNIYTCMVTNGDLYCYMEVYKLLNHKSGKFILDHYILLKKWEINKIISNIDNIDRNVWRIRIILPGDIEIYSNIDSIEIISPLDEYGKNYLINNKNLIGVLLHDKSITNVNILMLFDILYLIKQKYKELVYESLSIYNNLFNSKYNNFENFMVKKYIGEFRLSRFLNLITIFRFISENEEKYKNTAFSDKNYLSKSQEIITNTIKLMKECNQKDLTKLIVDIQTDFTNNKEPFKENFWYIMENNFSAKKQVTEVSFPITNIINQSKNIKKFWTILKDIYQSLLASNENMCDYVNLKAVMEETISKDEIDDLLIKKSLTSTI